MSAVLQDTYVFSTDPKPAPRVFTDFGPRHYLYEIRSNSTNFEVARLVKKMESLNFPVEYKDAELVVKSSLSYTKKAELFRSFSQLSRRSKAPGTLGYALVSEKLSAAEALAAARFVQPEQEEVLFNKIPDGSYTLTTQDLTVFSLDSLFRLLDYKDSLPVSLDNDAMELVIRRSCGCLGAAMAEKLYQRTGVGSRSRLVTALVAAPVNCSLLQDNINEVLRLGKENLAEIFVGSPTKGNLFDARMKRAIHAAFVQTGVGEAKAFILSELFDSGATFDTIDDALELM